MWDDLLMLSIDRDCAVTVLFRTRVPARFSSQPLFLPCATPVLQLSISTALAVKAHMSSKSPL